MDEITRRKCGMTFQELLDLGTENGYRPTILIVDREDWQLARAYDAAQAARGDERRAYTGNTAPQLGDIVLLHALNGWRRARIDKVGPKRIQVSFVTKSSLRDAQRRRDYLATQHEPVEPVVPSRNRKFLQLDTLIPNDAHTWKLR